MSTTAHPVDERLPTGRLAALGLQHVLVMYAGAVAVPLIVGRALKLSPEQVAMLISADLFCCGLVTLIQSLGATQWFGIRLPVMMGVTFASVAPMVAMANANPGTVGAQLIVRVEARAIFPNCPRYIPQMQLVSESSFIPKAGEDFVEPGWKSDDAFCDAIHPRADTYRG